MQESETAGTGRAAFVSTRIAGTDGVSLEIAKWTSVLRRMGIESTFIAGHCDRPADRSFVIPEADFRHPTIELINRVCFGSRRRLRQTTDLINSTARDLKNELYRALDTLQPEALIVENALTIPMNIPLGLAIVDLLWETDLPCIAHHHDFVWERERYLVNSVEDILGAVFPPRFDGMHHVVINSVAAGEFSRRTGQPCRVVPNVMDFEHEPASMDGYATDFRNTLGLRDDELLILQPTRIVARKGIEHSIELVKRLDRPARLVITHAAGDEGTEYESRIRRYAELMGVEVLFANPWICHERRTNDDGSKCYSVWDAYPHADLVAYPSTYEGFGNAFLEAVYFRKPIFCNRYAIFRTDIEPCGFRAAVMDGFVTDACVDGVRRLLDDESERRAAVDHNYETARRFFGYDVVERELRALLERPQPRSDLRPIEPRNSH